jgi:CubicO group peptidase (beta-lactamase class C family)
MKTCVATSPLLLLLLGLSLHGSEPEQVWPAADWPSATPAEVGMDAAKLAEARDYALRGGGSGCVIRHGRRILIWGDPKQLYDLKSSTKSFGATVLGLALLDGKVKLYDPARKYCPNFGVPPVENAETGWLDNVTLRMLATQTAGFEKTRGFGKLLFEPGTKWYYSDGGPNWLADCLTSAYRRDLCELMFDRVFGPIGIGRDDLRWRDNSLRPHQLEGIMRREFGSGISADMEAMSRFGYLYLHEGRWKDREILSRSFVELARRSSPEVARLPVLEPSDQPARDSSSTHYGLLWWNNNDGTLANVPRDAFWTWGLYDSLIVVIPSLDIVVARAGKSWPRAADAAHYDVLKPFLEPITAAVEAEHTQKAIRVPPPEADSRRNGVRPAASPANVHTADAAPYPPSPVITSVTFHDDTARTLAPGSDIWPLTWAADGQQYTVFGDGGGFGGTDRDGRVSLGIARVVGGKEDYVGVNIAGGKNAAYPAPFTGKSVGILAIDDTLYLWRNGSGSNRAAFEFVRLYRSDDHGATWNDLAVEFSRRGGDFTGADQGFFAPAFCQFGEGYRGARDNFVYVYASEIIDRSHWNVQKPGRIALLRVEKDRLGDKSAYRFFAGLDAQDQPLWTANLAERRPVWQDTLNGTHRIAVSYNAPLRRYLLSTMTADRLGHIGIFDAPEPWGPWSTVLFQKDTGRWGSNVICFTFANKWLSADGRHFVIVHTKNDSWASIEGEFTVATPAP